MTSNRKGQTMKTAVNSRSRNSRRGSVLLAAVLAIIILTIASMSVLDWAQYSIRETRRKERINKVRVAANNELEFLFYNWANEVDKPSSQSLEARLQAISIDGNPLVVDVDDVSTTAQDPAITTTDSDDSSVLPIQIARSLETLPTTGVGIVRMSGLDKTGSVGYYSAKVSVTMQDPRFGDITVRIGRRYTFQKASPFNFAVFYNGDLELNPAGNMIIGGDVQCNNSIFMGTNGANSLVVAGNIYFYDKFNGSTDPMAGTTNHQYKSGYNSPIFNPDPYGAGSPPDQAVARAEQVKKMDEKESFIANLDPQEVYNTFSSASPSPYASINDVQRALIAPPPTYNGALIPESQVVSANRMYNKAAIRMEVIDVNGTPTAKFYDASNTDITGKFSGVVTQVRTAVNDAREGKDVAITTIDVGALNAAINADSTLSAAYNGVVYMHDTAQLTDASNLYGIRLANADQVPDFNGKGFVVASNNGVYIQGDFNNHGATLNDDARCAILADSITLLSPGWNDANSAAPAIDDTLVDTAKRKATDSITVNAALVSGNTPSIDGSTGNSGGVQNLIRYLEDWTGFNTTVNGSIGQMYNAKYFNSYFKPNGLTYQVYQNPATRTLNFDRRLASQPPSGAPGSVIRYYRGDLFTW